MMVLCLCTWQGEDSREHLEDLGITQSCLLALVLRCCLNVLSQTFTCVSLPTQAKSTMFQLKMQTGGQVRGND